VDRDKVDEAWATEITRRVEEITSGEVRRALLSLVLIGLPAAR
jgi:hypothetical protein